MNIDILMSELVYRFSPIIYISNSENFYPCSINYLLKHSDLYQNSILQKKSPISEQDLILANNKSTIDINYKSYVENYNIKNSPPMYVTYYFSNNTIYLQFIFIFCFNVNKLDLFKRFTVEIDLKHKSIISAFFHTHKNNGMWVKKKDMHFLSGHPVVYCSRVNYSFFPKLGKYRFRAFKTDRCELGTKWLPKNIIGVDETAIWIDCSGRISMEKKIKFPGLKKWWRNDKYTWRKNRIWNWITRIFS